MCLTSLFQPSTKKSDAILAQAMAAQTAATQAASRAAVAPADSGDAQAASDARLRRLVSANGQGNSLAGGDLGPAPVGTKMLLGA